MTLHLVEGVRKVGWGRGGNGAGGSACACGPSSTPAHSFSHLPHLPSHFQVSYLVEVLRCCQHNSFPIIYTCPEDGHCFIMGVLLRQHLLVLLVTRKAMQVRGKVTFSEEHV